MEETQAIKTRSLIQDGLQIVDGSRVHVDTAALSRWAERRYLESFGRYKDLVAAGIGVAEDFDEMLRRAVKDTDKLGEYFSVPESEADSLLLDIVVSLKDQFLKNPDHGLQFYLGKRVRHGTVTGHLRGPLENTHLITEKTTETGEYKANTHWLPRLQVAETGSALAVEEAFRLFAEGYDALVDGLRNDRLHVNSREKPKGLFSFVVSPISYHVIRSAVQTDLTSSAFLQSCYAVFWALMDSSFAAARELIGMELKHEAVRLFDTLQLALRQNVRQDAAYQELSAAIRDTSVEVQRQFESMAEWFRRTEVEQASHMFEIRTLLSIAIESALKTHKGFTPEIFCDVTGDAVAASSVLVIVADVIFVVLDNICRRSQSGPSPRVNIVCAFNQENETLQLDITNPVGNVDRVEIEGRLEVIRKKIEKGDIKSGAQRDSGSGLLKIAAITSQSERASIKFGFDDLGLFRTSIVLSVIAAL